MNLIVLAKGIKSHFVRTPKLPALPPSSPEVSRPEMNGKDSMADGHPVIGNGSIDTHQNIEDHPKLTITDTVTGLTIILYPSFHSCFSLLWMHCFALTIGYLVVSLVLLAFYDKFLLLLFFFSISRTCLPLQLTLHNCLLQVILQPYQYNFFKAIKNWKSVYLTMKVSHRS